VNPLRGELLGSLQRLNRLCFSAADSGQPSAHVTVKSGLATSRRYGRYVNIPGQLGDATWFTEFERDGNSPHANVTGAEI
jgi:hypothetical protein